VTHVPQLLLFHKPSRHPVGDLEAYTIPLPYDRPPLTLNDRAYWRQRQQVSKVLRETVVAALHHLRVPTGATHAEVRLFYAPPEARVRDADNLIPTLKPCLDALTARPEHVRRRVAYGLVPDDTPAYVTWHPPVILDRGARPDTRKPLPLTLWLEVIPTYPTGARP
jgi:crossover junction endodeoxyribonuclease RusA